MAASAHQKKNKRNVHSVTFIFHSGRGRFLPDTSVYAHTCRQTYIYCFSISRSQQSVDAGFCNYLRITFLQFYGLRIAVFPSLFGKKALFCRPYSPLCRTMFNVFSPWHNGKSFHLLPYCSFGLTKTCLLLTESYTEIDPNSGKSNL